MAIVFAIAIAIYGVLIGWYVSMYISNKATKNNTAGINTELQDLNRSIGMLRKDIQRAEKSNYDAHMLVIEALENIEIEIVDEFESDTEDLDELTDHVLNNLDFGTRGEDDET